MEEQSLEDRVLLARHLSRISKGFLDHDGWNLMLRNGRWGTCVACPRDRQGVHPELCIYTSRHDHNIHSTRGGRFFEYDKEIPRPI